MLAVSNLLPWSKQDMFPVFSTNLVFLCVKVFETSFQNRINYLYNSRFLRLFCLNYIKSRLHFQLFSATMKSDHFAIASSDWNGIQSFFQIGNRSAACRGITCRKDGYCIMRKRLNRVLSAALSAVMLLSLWPTAALAAPTSTSHEPTSEQSLLTDDIVTSTPAAAPSNGDAYTVGDDTNAAERTLFSRFRIIQ